MCVAVKKKSQTSTSNGSVTHGRSGLYAGECRRKRETAGPALSMELLPIMSRATSVSAMVLTGSLTTGSRERKNHNEI